MILGRFRGGMSGVLNLEFLLRPYQRALVDQWPRPTPAIMAPFFTGVNIRAHAPIPPSHLSSAHRLVRGVFAGCYQPRLLAGSSRRYCLRVFPRMPEAMSRASS